MRRAICLLLICIGFMTAANSAAQQQPLTEEEAFQLGVDAYIYGYPLVVMDSVRRVNTNVAEPQPPRGGCTTTCWRSRSPTSLPASPGRCWLKDAPSS